MSSTDVVLEMPQEYKTKWVEALRSGQYAQAKGALFTFTKPSGESTLVPPSEGAVPTGFCCLGVLLDVIEGREALLSDRCTDEESSLPNISWYRARGMDSFAAMVKGFNPDKLLLRDPSSSLRADSGLTVMNDGYEYREDDFGRWITVEPKSFLEIADYIEANVKGV